MSASRPSADRAASQSAERSADLAFSWAVAVVALLPRLFVAIAWSREPVWDGHYYDFGARRIAEGLGYSDDLVVNGVKIWHPWCHYPVGYSAFLAPAYKLFGAGPVVGPVMNALVGTLLVVVVHRLALRGLTENRARLAAGIVALHPGLIIYSAVLMNELLCALLVLLGAWIAVRRLRWMDAVFAGVVFGFATLVRPASLLVAPLVALVLPLPRLTALARGAVVTVIAIATVLPWTFRNCRVMDGCALVSTNGGWNLAIGALTPTGRFHTLHASDGCKLVTGQVQQDRCWAEVGFRAIERDPLRYLSLVPKKLAQTYDHESFAIEYLREADPKAWPESRRVAGRALLTVFHQILLVAAALALVALPSPRRVGTLGSVVQGALLLGTIAFAGYAAQNDAHPFWILAAVIPLAALVPLPGSPSFSSVERFLAGFVFMTSLTHAVFFGDDRYHLVVTPALAILASSALRRRAKRTPSEAPA
ncbi:MAG TPA: glycosyltransferase family 39 protein [Polyangiaceae bacterium]|nr:glycosyltransferase family 39 protein [Polyangiaceae bacterium]